MKYSGTFYRSILENINSGYAFHKILTDSSGEPVEYVSENVSQFGYTAKNF